MESSERDEQEEGVGTPVPQEQQPRQQDDEVMQQEDEVMQQEDEAVEQSDPKVETVESEEWWKASESAPDWSEPATEVRTGEDTVRKQGSTADVYFCGHTNLFPLNRALRAISQERLTGVLRAFWEQEPAELLARDGEIVLVTTRDPNLYCSDNPAVLTNVDVVNVDRARAQQKENGTPFFLTLAREESIGLDAATGAMREYGQKLFSQLWTAPRVWIMFEKNADALGDLGDLPGDPDVRDWVLETLRLVQNPEQHGGFDPASIPAYTKDGFERVQRLKLTSDEAQFASQFNGARPVQQIAKNLRLDLKSARQLLFRFAALDIVECWPGNTAAKPQKRSFFKRLGRRDR
jgi:hypothetical protein